MNTKAISLLTALLLAPIIWVGAASADVVVVVSAKSRIASLTKNQVADLFLGKSTTFPNGEQAIPIELAEGDEHRDKFHDAITRKSATQLKAYWSKMVFSGRGTPPKVVPNEADARKLVTDNPNAITYIDKSAVNNSVKIVFE